MVTLNAFVHERAQIASKIIQLSEAEYDNQTDNNLADDERWALEDVLKYFNQRINEIQHRLGGD
jgi:hypothetical protein